MAWAEQRGKQWVGFYRVDGKKFRAGTARSKKAAERLGEDQEARARGGMWHNPRAGLMPFSEYFLEHWLPNKTVEVQTLQQYLSHYDQHLGPRFGSMPVNKITFSEVQRWVIQLQRSELSHGTVRAIFTTLQTCLGAHRGLSAIRDGLIRESPCVGVELPPKPRRRVAIYEPEEVRALMAAMPEWWRPIPIFLADTGMRWGEMLGLRISDFEPGYEGVMIQRTIERCTKRNAARLETAGGYRIKDRTKNGAARHVPLSPIVRTLVARMVIERELFPQDHLFSTRGRKGKPKRTDEWPHGNPISNGSFRTQVWAPAHEKAGIPLRRIHDLRASNITWLLETQSVGAVMRRVGHSSIAVTDRYVGAMKDEDQRTVAALDAVWQTHG